MGAEFHPFRCFSCAQISFRGSDGLARAVVSRKGFSFVLECFVNFLLAMKIASVTINITKDACKKEGVIAC